MPSMSQADRTEIDDVLARHCVSVDLKEWDGHREVFTPEAEVENGPYDQARQRGIDAIVSLLRWAAHDRATLHQISTSLIRGGAVDSAEAVTYFTAYHTPPGDPATSFVAVGIYHDRFVRTSAGWRIANRRVEPIAHFGDPSVMAHMFQMPPASSDTFTT